MPARSRIEQQIAAAGGWISFARYMHLALHEPGIGYYASGARKFGAGGDFVTAPELGTLFGRTLARALRAFDRILEIGAGSGALADVLTRELQCEYWILETSGALRSRQEQQLGKRVRHLERLPERFQGAVIANEVVDAMPVHLVHWTDSGILERGAGAELLGYTSQASFLVNCGITEALAEANAENALRYAPIAAQAQRLLSPAEMGELFKVLAVGRGVAEPLAGFSRGDRSASL